MQIGSMDAKNSVKLRADSAKKMLKDLRKAESRMTAKQKSRMRELRNKLSIYVEQQQGNGHIELPPILYHDLNAYV